MARFMAIAMNDELSCKLSLWHLVQRYVDSCSRSDCACLSRESMRLDLFEVGGASKI